jgi:hypothetical protein
MCCVFFSEQEYEYFLLNQFQITQNKAEYKATYLIKSKHKIFVDYL